MLIILILAPQDQFKKILAPQEKTRKVVITRSIYFNDAWMDDVEKQLCELGSSGVEHAFALLTSCFGRYEDIGEAAK